jgi:hypothetical protein
MTGDLEILDARRMKEQNGWVPLGEICTKTQNFIVADPGDLPTLSQNKILKNIIGPFFFSRIKYKSLTQEDTGIALGFRGTKTGCYYTVYGKYEEGTLREIRIRW